MKVTSLAALAGRGKVEGSKSDQTSLGGNSLLDCVVYARVAGAACAKYVWGDNVKVTSLAALACPGKVEGPKSDQPSMGRNSRVVFVLVLGSAAFLGGVKKRGSHSWHLKDQLGLTFAGLVSQRWRHCVSSGVFLQICLYFNGCAVIKLASWHCRHLAASASVLVSSFEKLHY